MVMLIGQPAIGAWGHFAALVSREFQSGRPSSPTSTPMRRIPRPSRAIDPSHAISASLRQRTSPLGPCPHLRTTSAAFSTTTPNAFLLPGKQDKKKHQQFVRRWQKRLLGDSEPVGAHVDPYDPTSPIRIAPEELGEYEEVLEEEENGKRGSRGKSAVPTYKPASNSRGLQRAGGEEWLKQKAEEEMAREFEKLTLRTYTPLSLEMADQIEELTGTPYTLKDDNLMMAQTVHEITNRPYTDYNFGLHRRTAGFKELRNRFTQAVAEVYALKQAGIDMDLSKFANRGVYAAPHWVKDIKLVKTENADIILDLPLGRSLEDFVEVMQTIPELEPEALVQGGEEDLLVEEAEELLEPVLPQEQLPTMDPATPEYKRAAVVKADAGKKPFDFMSNRPVPRAKPVSEPLVEEVVSQPAHPVENLTSSPPPADQEKAMDDTPNIVTEDPKHSIFADKAQQFADDFAALKQSAEQSRASKATIKAEELRWQQISITDVAVKFALFKRLYQLTNYRVPDVKLASINNLGELFNLLSDASKPQPASLFTAMLQEGQRARQRAKRQPASDVSSKRKADLGDLITLGNVELRREKPTKTEKRVTTGLQKVIGYALWERGLASRSRITTPSTKGKKTRRVAREGGKQPQFVKALSSKGAAYLAKTAEGKSQQLKL
ncbi:Ribosomal-L50 domain containing protein [Pyrenophora tritici-repentis]|uniref:Large ribosomal subunit protein mL50 n=1 Tax=Pyrenophora tritici-repentis TaxID=45151 RepID=A0A2W1FLY9_9PLEO|nr:Ribosomal-L50 domain containing protein [Pyrenophora tritici-repentis]KAI0570952.1 Ribosomal-L50 domain-containing protein [Pyrenophora tritici-repentis]KAI1508353.1 Ribosomal protein [Pyrenophora tritici-repentis]KAI1595676.1 Ribosomal-L50 domain containing protein [Pyrenophora tritici-repentis]KAI1665937.1 Ribosomal protein [Pyrenophora tritici-repentis]